MTTNNFFTSIHVGMKLRKKNTSLAGTLNKIRRKILPLVKSLQQSKYSSKLLQAINDSNQTTNLTVYQCKQKKNLCVLSTLCTIIMVDNKSKKKTETVTFYNKTKCSVNIADQMAQQYMVKAGSQRWPVAVFRIFWILLVLISRCCTKRRLTMQSPEEILCLI